MMAPTPVHACLTLEPIYAVSSVFHRHRSWRCRHTDGELGFVSRSGSTKRRSGTDERFGPPLVALCDQDYELSPRGRSWVERQPDQPADLEVRQVVGRFSDLRGEEACDQLLKRFGPEGSTASGLVVSKSLILSHKGMFESFPVSASQRTCVDEARPFVNLRQSVVLDAFDVPIGTGAEAIRRASITVLIAPYRLSDRVTVACSSLRVF
jgi:hypothetical protein